MHRPKISHTRTCIIRWTMKNRTNPKSCRTGVTRTSHCPLSPKADWPKILLLIMSYATSPTQRDVMLLGALTAIGASMERYVRCPYAGKLQSPCLQSFIVAPSPRVRDSSFIRLLVEPIHDEIRQKSAEEVKAYKKSESRL